MPNFWEHPSAEFDQLSSRNMKNWLNYNITWIENKNELEILYLNYEDLVLKKSEIILTSSKFIGLEIDEKTRERVIQNTSIDFMKNMSPSSENKNGKCITILFEMG
jgi:hypothetical protein